MVKPGRRMPRGQDAACTTPRATQLFSRGRAWLGEQDAAKQGKQESKLARDRREPVGTAETRSSGAYPQGSEKGLGGGRALRFKKPPKSVLKPNTMSKPNLTRHKVGDLLANF